MENVHPSMADILEGTRSKFRVKGKERMEISRIIIRQNLADFGEYEDPRLQTAQGDLGHQGETSGSMQEENSINEKVIARRLAESEIGFRKSFSDDEDDDTASFKSTEENWESVLVVVERLKKTIRKVIREDLEENVKLPSYIGKKRTATIIEVPEREPERRYTWQEKGKGPMYNMEPVRKSQKTKKR